MEPAVYWGACFLALAVFGLVDTYLFCGQQVIDEETMTKDQRLCPCMDLVVDQPFGMLCMLVWYMAQFESTLQKGVCSMVRRVL